MRTAFLLLAVCSFSLARGQASRPVDPYSEIGITGGYSYYIGDINPYAHFGPSKQIAYGALFRRNITQRLAFRFHLMRMKVEAYDADSNDPMLINRNLNFRSNITEGAVLLEVNFYNYRLGRLGKGFTPYLFGGLAYFSFNPEAELDGNYFELRPLGTEGQGNNTYSKGQVAIPVGLGFKAGLSKRVALNLEWGIRRTFTDYLDDVSGNYADPDAIRNQSGDLGRALADRTLVPIGPDGVNTGMQRGDPERNDWYIYSGIILTVRLGKDSNGCWR